MRTSLLALVGLLALSACSGGADTKAAQAGVERIHHQIDAGQFHEVYSAASNDLKLATPEAELTALLSAVHSKLGKVQSARQQGWKANYGTSGGSVELIYETKFEHGTGEEDFIFKTGGAQPLLYGYHINSNLLAEH